MPIWPVAVNGFVGGLSPFCNPVGQVGFFCGGVASFEVLG